MAEIRYGKAINQALHDAMTADPMVVLFGEDVGEAGGPFKATRGLIEAFGAGRVRDTPISEAAIAGMAVGAALTTTADDTQVHRRATQLRQTAAKRRQHGTGSGSLRSAALM